MYSVEFSKKQCSWWYCSHGRQAVLPVGGPARQTGSKCLEIFTQFRTLKLANMAVYPTRVLGAKKNWSFSFIQPIMFFFLAKSLS